VHGTLRDIALYYDVMDLWTRWNAGFRSFSGREAQAIHRWLTNPVSGEFSPRTIHQIMLGLDFARHSSISALDAGCGYGGSMLAFHAALGGRWHGMTISRRQYAAGRAAARRKGVTGAVSFALASFDQPQPAAYDLVYAIESLIHSADPQHTIGNLVRALRPGGSFVIVDDMPVDDVPEASRADLAAFQRLWRCPAMPSANAWCAHLAAAGCEVVVMQDLNPLMRPRTTPEIAQAIGEVAARRRWRDRVGLRRIGEAETGGLLLERMHREGAVEYKLIEARKVAP